MKRIDHQIAGRPKSDCTRRDLAGMPASPQRADVASFRHAFGRALEDPTAAFAEDAMLLEDFGDFLDEGDEAYGEHGLSVLQANPDFRERLRARLWRTFVQTHLRDGGGRH